MIFKSNFHTHTCYCDGKNTVDEMAQAAVELGFTSLGFSGHAYTDFDLSYCMKAKETADYITDVEAAKKKYAGTLNIYCGTELDYYSPLTDYKYDFTIGSVHYLKFGDEYPTVDSSAQCQLDAAKKYLGGDYMSYAEKYFETVADVADHLHPSFIGHFDLVSKFNENDCMFDSHNPRYVNAWKTAAERLCAHSIPFEINTGAIARGKRLTPYPSLEMAEFISEHGGFFIVTSDCHNKDFLTCAFDDVAKNYSRFEIIDFEDLLRNKKR